MAKTNTKPARGTRDILPAEIEVRDHAMATILASYRRFGFQRVETPALEHLSLLTSGQGGDNEKLIYRILERGSKLDLASAETPDDVSSLGLRFDLTVPLARFYAEHHGELPTPFKAIQIGPVWRAERPQKGRYRQFVQCDIDVLGDGGAAVEAELVQATTEALAALGLADFEVRINHRALLELLASRAGFAPERIPSVLITLDKLDKIGHDGVRHELLAAGDDAAAVQRLADSVAAGAEGLDALQATLVEQGGEDAGLDACCAHLRAILDACAATLPDGAAVRFDPTLVRGMGYYTGPIFEVGVQGWGFSLAGGGRYDRMVGDLIGRDVPACGFSIGFERLVLVLQEHDLLPARGERRIALLHDPERDAPAAVLAAAEGLRRSRSALVSTLPRRKKLGKQIDDLRAQGFDAFSVFEDGAAGEPRDLGERVG